MEIIVGANGIVISYVIRQNSVPDLSDQLKWDKKAALVAPHTGNKYKLYALAVNKSSQEIFRKPLMHTRISNLRSRK